MRNPIDFNIFHANPLKVLLSSIYCYQNFAETRNLSADPGFRVLGWHAGSNVIGFGNDNTLFKRSG